MTGRDQLDPFGDDRRSAWAWVELSNLMRLDAAIRLWIDQIKDLRSGGEISRSPKTVRASLPAQRDATMDRDALLSAIRQRNRERLPRLIDIERRAREGYALSRNDREDIIEGMECASSSLALIDPDRQELILARRILLLCDSIRSLILMNDQRRYCARFRSE